MHPKGRIFGKQFQFVLGVPPSLRGFEIELGVRARTGRAAWISRFPSVHNLLNHLRRYTQSESSKEKYLRHLAQFCRWFNLTPEKLVRLPKGRLESLIQSFADELVAKGLSKAYVNSVIKRLRTFARVNGFVHNRELTLRTYFIPSRYRKVPEYIPTKGEVHAIADAAGSRRDRAIILILWSSGLRVSTLCALNYSDVAAELEKDKPYIMIPVYSSMKERVPDACKGLISYYTFVCQEASEALKSYIREREEKYGKIQLSDPLFHSDWTLWPRTERSGRRLGRRGIGLIVKRAARLAGLKLWKRVTPHCLRKAFESVLRAPTIDGGHMDISTQQFLFGHILPGSRDAYYDKTSIEFHRREYAKLDWSRAPSTTTVDKLVGMDELEKYLSDRWAFVAKISEDKVVVRRSGARESA